MAAEAAEWVAAVEAAAAAWEYQQATVRPN